MKFKNSVFSILIILGSISCCFAQPNHADLIQQLGDKNQKERIFAIRGLSVAIVRGLSTTDQRSATVDALTKLTSDDDPVIRLSAHVELLKIAAAEDNTELSKFAIQSCNDPIIKVRRGTLKFFRSFYAGRYDSGKMHEALLLEKINDPDFETRFHAAATLQSWGISNEKIIDIMIDSLELNNYRASSLHLLQTREKNREKLIDMLMQRLESSEHNAGIHINTLAILTPESKTKTTQLLKYFDNKSVSVRAAVVDAIGRLQSARKESLEVLDRAAKDESPLIRRLVISSLIRLEPEQSNVKKTMLQLMQDDDEGVCLAASDAFSWFEDDFEAIRTDVEKALASDNKNQVMAALNGCLTSGPMSQALGPAVATLLRTGDPDVQIRACWALEEMDVDRKVFLDAAEYALNNNPSEESIATILDTMSRFATSRDDCRNWFVKYIDNEDPKIRLSCCIGLKNYPSSELIEKVIMLPRPPRRRTTGQLLNIDNAVLDFLVATGEDGARLLVPLITHNEAHVRARAIRAIAKSQIVTEEIRKQIVAALGDDDIFVRTCAAHAVTELGQLDSETLETVFNVSDPNDRQQTIRILKLFASLGKEAAPITPRIAYLMSGGYRNRFATDAMKTLISLGEHAAPATDSLLVEPLNLRQIECLAAIGPGARKAEQKLRQTITELESKIGQTRLMSQEEFFRRNRMGAAIALWRVSGDQGPAARIIKEELDGNSRNMALTALPSFQAVDADTVNKVISFLPDPLAINALGQLGDPAHPAVESLKRLTENDNPSLSFEAKKALWKITGDPSYAIRVVQQVLQRNRFSLVEIRVEDRQPVWEALRFLDSTEDAKAKEMLDQIQNGRFPNLRNFVRQLRESNSAS